VPEDRRRREIGRSERACGLCASVGMTIIESRSVRRGAHLLNPLYRPRVRIYERCDACGAKHHLHHEGQRV
jgi:hypothetical protein